MSGMGKSIRNLYVDDAAYDEDEENDAASGEAAEDTVEAEEAGTGEGAGEATETGADGEGGGTAEDAVSSMVPHLQLALLANAVDVKGLSVAPLFWFTTGLPVPADLQWGLLMRQAEDGAASADSSEEEEEGNDEYDYADNFLAREDEEEEELAEQPEDSDGEKERKRRKRKRRARALQLDNEDYELLEENQVSVSASTRHIARCAVHLLLQGAFHLCAALAPASVARVGSFPNFLFCKQHTRQ